MREEQEPQVPDFLTDVDVWNELGALTVQHGLAHFVDENGAPVETAQFDEEGRLRFKVRLPREDKPRPLAERTIGDMLGGTLPRTEIDRVLVSLPLNTNRVERAKALLLAGIAGIEIQLALRTTPATVLKARKEIIAEHKAALDRGENPAPLPYAVIEPKGASSRGRPKTHQTLLGGRNPLDIMAADLGISREGAAVLRGEKRRQKRFKDDDATRAPEAVHKRERESGGR